MTHQMRLVISTALIGSGFSIVMVAIAFQLGYNIGHNIDPVLLGWIFGVLAMGTVVMYDNYTSPRPTTGGK